MDEAGLLFTVGCALCVIGLLGGFLAHSISFMEAGCGIGLVFIVVGGLIGSFKKHL